jgi:hypothetical protein
LIIKFSHTLLSFTSRQFFTPIDLKMRLCRLMCGGGSAPPEQASLDCSGYAPDSGHSSKGAGRRFQKVIDLPHIGGQSPHAKAKVRFSDSKTNTQKGKQQNKSKRRRSEMFFCHP